jgi:hypothetical protein
VSQVGEPDLFLVASRRALPLHYPLTGGLVGAFSARGGCICGWRGRRYWSFRRSAILRATNDYADHIFEVARA